MAAPETRLAKRAGEHDQPEDGVPRPVVEQEAEPRSREALDPPDRLHQPCDEACPTATGPEFDLAPALRQPDLVAPGDQLKRHEDRDDFEYVRGAAGRERQRGNAEQEDEDQREALLLEHVDEAAERLVAVARQPALDLIADLLRRGACLYRRDPGGGDVRCGHSRSRYSRLPPNSSSRSQEDVEDVEEDAGGDGDGDGA